MKLEHMTEVQLRTFLNDVAGTITQKLAMCCGPNDRPKFALLLFDDPDVAQYVSSCNRQDMIKALREAATRLENREDVPR